MQLPDSSGSCCVFPLLELDGRPSFSNETIKDAQEQIDQYNGLIRKVDISRSRVHRGRGKPKPIS